MAEINEASPICRGKNLSWETVLLFFNNMPRKSMPKADFHTFVESKINGWTQTHSQIARQLAFYYEKDGICYPRFIGKVSYSDLFLYMQNWASKYFIPNPYAPSLKGKKPTCIYSYIRKAIIDGNNDIDEVLDSIFDIKLSSHDKVNVYLSNFTDIIIASDHKMTLSERTMFKETELYPNEELVSDVKKYFDYFSINLSGSIEAKLETASSKARQQIYYGAPGTGKSHKTNEVTSKYPDTVRTTFHPDSDYSTFVGAYKPTMTKVRKAVVIGQDEKEVKPLDGNSEWEEKIAYKFVKQAFLKAYVKAWKKFAETCVEGGELAPQYLVIEEINRGNCAQIFGDLFQLLDRKQNFSEYPIEADADICKTLLEEDTKDNPSFGAEGLQLTDEQKTYINNVYDGKPVAEKICRGEVLVLPPNLYILATMNTSDQSLFPIDSAFKRRWEWKYMKIKEGKDKDGNKLDWKIVVKDKDGGNVKIKDQDSLSWWAFIQKINAIIASMTSSADKQLGYFFCKADEDGVINGETFVSKVIFYLWNDVFKDYGFEDASLFRYKAKEGEKEVEKDLTFPDFYDEDGEKVDSKRLVDFIQKVMDWQKPEDNA